MKRALLVFLAACSADVPRPSSECACSLDFSEHPRADALQDIVDGRVAGGLPGLVVAVRTPEGLWAGAAGYANLEDAVPMNVCHMDHLASVAKTYTGALALKLQEQGLLDLDDKLADYLDAELLRRVPNADGVTLRQLADHTSGIPDFNSDVGYITGELNDPAEQNTPEDLVDEMRGEDPLWAPGEGYSYSDGNHVLLALAIDAVTGDYRQAMRDQILAPLGLAATTVYERGVPEPDCMCNTYWEVGPRALENVSDASAEYATHDIGADGVGAAPLDALAFIEAVVRGDLLSEESFAEMTAWSAPSQLVEDGYGYGVGLARRDTVTGPLYGHTGGGIGTGAVVRASPDQEVTFVAATNTGMFLPGDLDELFSEELWDDIAAAAGLTP